MRTFPSLLLETEEEREEGKERNIDVSENKDRHPDQGSNPQTFSYGRTLQATEPHRLGHSTIILN